MTDLTKNILRFILFAFAQALIFNNLEIGFGIHLMVHPLFVMLLPFEIGVFSLMSLAFVMGAIIDVFSNTYGLYASSLLMMAFFRPIIFKFYSGRSYYVVIINFFIQNPKYFNIETIKFISLSIFILLFGWYLFVHLIIVQIFLAYLTQKTIEIIFHRKDSAKDLPWLFWLYGNDAWHVEHHKTYDKNIWHWKPINLQYMYSKLLFSRIE